MAAWPRLLPAAVSAVLVAAAAVDTVASKLPLRLCCRLAVRPGADVSQGWASTAAAEGLRGKGAVGVSGRAYEGVKGRGWHREHARPC